MATKAQRKKIEDRVVFDAFMATCPSRQVFSTVGDKWSGLVINALSAGPMRHGQLMARIVGASQKMLTQTLRTLERDGIVSRTVTPRSATVSAKFGLRRMVAGWNIGSKARLEPWPI